jgi:hypothetical protein
MYVLMIAIHASWLYNGSGVESRLTISAPFFSSDKTKNAASVCVFA